MSVPIFTPVTAPAYSSSKGKSYRVLSAAFGDGYTQRVGDGLNVISRKMKLDFENLTPVQADDMEAFFDALYGVLPFYYTLPLETVQAAWITDGETPITRTYVGPNSITLAINIKEVFDIL